MRIIFYICLALACVSCALAASVLPTQGHLAYGGKPESELSVTWATPNTTTPSDYSGNVVYGTTSGALSASANASANQFKCYTLGPVMHSALLSRLSAATTYFYRFGDARYGFSEEYSFKTAPAAASAASTTFAWWGDMGVMYSNNTVARLTAMANARDVDFFLHIGDIAYANNRVAESKGTWYEQFLDLFYDDMANASSHIPTMYSPGNHEFECAWGDYPVRVRMPYEASGSPSPFFYAFTHGRTRFIQTSTETADAACGKEYNRDSEQYKWIEKQLAAAADARDNDNTLDFIIVTGHRPIYCSYNWSSCCYDHCNTNDSRLWNNPYAANLEDLLNTYKVDVFLNGHTHNSERTLPVRHNTPFPSADNVTFHNPPAPIYITAGSPGDIEVMGTEFLRKPDWSATQIPAWDKAHKVPYHRAGYGLIDIQGTRLHYRLVSSLTGEALDEMILIKS